MEWEIGHAPDETLTAVHLLGCIDVLDGRPRGLGGDDSFYELRAGIRGLKAKGPSLRVGDQDHRTADLIEQCHVSVQIQLVLFSTR